METKNREIQALDYGKLQTVETALLTKPLAKNEFIVKIELAPVNPSDFYYILGKYPSSRKPPFRVGFEGFGIIEKAGDELSNHLIGKFCLAMSARGVYGTRLVLQREEFYVLADDANLESVKKNFLINPMTAYEMLEIVKEHKAASFIHTVASSNVGKWLTHLARNNGMKSIAIIRNDKHTKELMDLGAAVVLNSTDDAYTEKLQNVLNEHKPTILLDALGGDKPVKIFEGMPLGSTFVFYGAMESVELKGLTFGLLCQKKIVRCYKLDIDTVIPKGHKYVEEAINKIFKDKTIIDEQIEIMPLESADTLVKVWPQRKAKIVFKP